MLNNNYKKKGSIILRFIQFSFVGLFLIGFNGYGYADISDASVASKVLMHESAGAPVNWDFDKNGEVDALTDGLLMLRYSFDMRGEALTSGVISTNSPLSAVEVEAEMAASLAIADIDGDVQVDALTDGLLFLRYLFDLTDDSLVSGAIAQTASRSSAAEITQYLVSHMPGADTDTGNTTTDDGDNSGADNENDGSDNTGVDNGNTHTGPLSDYCATPIYHLQMQSESGSAIDLTIENTGNNSLSVSVTSSNGDAVNDLLVESSTGATVSSDNSGGTGVFGKILSWSGSAPANESMNILWSKVSTGGMWIVRNISVPVDATCGGSNTDGNGGSNTDGNGGSNTGGTDDNAADPDENEADILSIFSDNYSDLAGTDFDPDWGQSTSVSVANGQINYQGLNYQGTNFSAPIDVSGYGYFHVDFYTENSTTLQLFLVNSADVTGTGPVETSFMLNITPNQWNTVEIPLSAFTPIVDLTQVDQLKIVGNGSVTWDNWYFGGVSQDDNGGFYGGNEVIQTEEISVANGLLVGGTNSDKPQFVVYVFDNDPVSGQISNCYGGCASAWPPVYVTDDTPSGIGGLDSIDRSDGSKQVTYQGRPLYFYVGDQQAGDSTGDNVSGWHSVEYGNIGQVNKLYNDSTVLEPITSFVRDDGVVVTRLADRGRDRHAKDSGFQDHYDHYLAHYWEFRTMRIQLEDYVPAGQSRIAVTWITEAELGAREFRVWYSGATTTGQFHFNPQKEEEKVNPNETGAVYVGKGTWNDNFEKISNQGNQYKYTLNIVNKWENGGQFQLPLQSGMNMEFEASMFLLNPPAGARLNYYGTSFVYVIGQPGVEPFEWRPGQADGTPIPEKGLSGGKTSLGYNYTNEPAGRFMQMATNMSPGNAQPFVRGRRIHHTSFVNGVHGERHDNPVWSQQAGKAGKYYINDSCASCHVRNGRALVADVGDQLDKWVFKVGDQNGDPLPSIGSVLQPVKIGSGTSEGSVSLGAWTEHANGLRSPNYQFSNATPPQFSARIAPSLVGIGLLEAIDESTIISWADENDENQDGISGRASIVEDPASGVMRLGRFGYKAGTFSVKHQVASALNTDMGVMTSLLPNPDCGSQQSCGNSGSELADNHVDDLVKYVSLLGVGARRNYNNQSGESLFQSVGCAGCHRPSMVTSQFHPLAELRSQTIYPYTDLLLHDMGEGLADNLAEGSASGSEWRTAPLWGLGLAKNVMLGDAKGNDLVSEQRQYDDINRIGYLHDGRARTIDEAIRWHGGEALESKNAYEALSDGERNAIITFLESL